MTQEPERSSKPRQTFRRLRTLAIGCCFSAVCLVSTKSADSPKLQLKPEQHSNPHLSTLANHLALPEEELLSEAGIWHFEGLNWEISQHEPNPLPPNIQPGVPANLDVQPNSTDSHIIELIHSMMRGKPSANGQTHYAVRTNELCASAVTVQVGETEVPVGISVWWPASGDLWKEFQAFRLPSEKSSTPTVDIPFPHSVVATRFASDRQFPRHLILTQQTFDAIETAFAAIDWTIDKPPENVNSPKLFVMTKGNQSFEVRSQPRRVDSDTLLIIRRIR